MLSTANVEASPSVQGINYLANVIICTNHGNYERPFLCLLQIRGKSLIDDVKIADKSMT